jgi:GH35 family endo-1,4-beta-xylanase
MTHFKGRVLEHDVDNEMMHSNYFVKRLGPEIRKQLFEWCHQYDPDAALYLNDFGIFSGDETDKYVEQIQGFLDQDMPIGGIGIQGHLNPWFSADEITEKLDKLAVFDLPIKITECDLTTDNEELKAKLLITLYSAAFAHPAVEGIYMWGFWRGLQWRRMAALWDQDWSMTPAAKARRELLFKAWWTDEEAMSDANGACQVRVFYGQHDITVNGQTHRFSVTPDMVPVVIDCRAEDPGAWTCTTGAGN